MPFIIQPKPVRTARHNAVESFKKGLGYYTMVLLRVRSSAWIERLIAVQEVTGSNPAGRAILQSLPFLNPFELFSIPTKKFFIDPLIMRFGS